MRTEIYFWFEVSLGFGTGLGFGFGLSSQFLGGRYVPGW